MEQLLDYLPAVFTWSNFLVLACGSLGGLLFGAMPGLSPTMAVALLVVRSRFLGGLCHENHEYRSSEVRINL